MKIWRDDITKDKLKNGSVTMASIGMLLFMFAPIIINYPKVAYIVCSVIAVMMIVLSVVLHIKARTLEK